MKALFLALTLASTPGAWAARKVAPVGPLSTPVAPAPVLAQLRLDLAALGAARLDAGPPAALASSPATWANLKGVLAPIDSSAKAPPALPPALAAGAPPASAGPSAVEADAAERVGLARALLERFEPAAFERLAPEKKDALLAELWDGWRARGLVAAGEDAGAAALDRLILEGVRDRELTASSKSIFLGAALLGYPLQDSFWLARTRINHAQEENRLSYPEGQRWKNDSGTPEFLGQSARAQALVDGWGAAANYARQIVAQVRRGSRTLPRSAAASPEAAAGLARVAEELFKAGDREALDYLAQEDPTFAAFLLDAHKPGYFLYNGDASAIGRILKTKAAAALGLRRVEHVDESLPAFSTYLYRPRRVAQRLEQAAGEPIAEPGVSDPQAERMRARLLSYLPRVRALAPQPPPGSRSPFAFAAAEHLPGSALESARNRLAPSKDGAGRLSRYELPLTAGGLRAGLAAGKRHPALDERLWRGLAALFSAAPALRAAPGGTAVTLVSESYPTRGRLFAPDARGGLIVQLAALEELERLSRGDPRPRAEFARFVSAAVAGALP